MRWPPLASIRPSFSKWQPGSDRAGCELFSKSRASPGALSQDEDTAEFDRPRERQGLRHGLAGVLVIPLSCDYAIWSEHAAARVEAFSQLPQSRSEIKGLALWVDGKVSERAAQELKNRKIDLATDVLAKQ